ncbi:hypothetical protein K1719_030844 [Acacia pycnantha]|nr:hypothetical protein K1719_030844 [Acacia pycnantha]
MSFRSFQITSHLFIDVNLSRWLLDNNRCCGANHSAKRKEDCCLWHQLVCQKAARVDCQSTSHTFHHTFKAGVLDLDQHGIDIACPSRFEDAKFAFGCDDKAPNLISMGIESQSATAASLEKKMANRQVNRGVEEDR